MPLHYRTCNLCEAMCGLEIEYDGTEVQSIRGDKQDPFSRGHICPKAVGLKDIYEDPDRLKQPIRKTSSGWEVMDWEDALDFAAEGLQRVQKTHGPQSLGIYLGNPNAHNFGSLINTPNFIRSLKSRNRFSATSADQLPHHFAALKMFGHYMMIPVPDIDRTHYMLMLGANPLVSNGSLMTAPDVAKRLKSIQERGGKIVVIDPRRTESAKKADQHFFIQPGKDAWLLLALVHCLYDEQLIDLGALEAFTQGVEELKDLVAAYSPERAASLTGISSQDIRQIARDFSAAESAVCYGRMGVSTQAFGGLCQWLVNVINILTGNLDKAGGAMFTKPAFDTVGMSGARGKVGGFDRWRSRIRQLPELAGEIPCSEMADEILQPGEGQIKAMITVAGNPVLSTPNGNKLDKALAGLDFMLSIDIYRNETTRHADLILPSTTGLETEQYDVLFNLFSVRNTSKYSPALFEREAHQRHDWEILQGLTARLNGQETASVAPAIALDFALKKGPYDLDLVKLKDAPHGLDLGALSPCLPERLFTENKQLNLLPEVFASDLQRLEKDARSKPQEEYPLNLIGRRQLRSNNSWMHNASRLVKGGNRCTLMIHPEDAARHDLSEGQEVTVSSATGIVRLPAQITQEVMKGVVSIPHGWGHQRPGVSLKVAQDHPGVSINDLTDTQLIDELTGNAAFSGVPVKIHAS